VSWRHASIWELSTAVMLGVEWRARLLLRLLRRGRSGVGLPPLRLGLPLPPLLVLRPMASGLAWGPFPLRPREPGTPFRPDESMEGDPRLPSSSTYSAFFSLGLVGSGVPSSSSSSSNANSSSWGKLSFEGVGLPRKTEERCVALLW